MRRRLLRGRMFALGLLFIIYSAINVYSSSVIASAAGSESAPNDLSTISPKSDDAGSNDGKVMSAFTLEKPQPTTSRTKAPTTAWPRSYRPRTYRLKRQNCTPPAIEQFPLPLLPPWFRENGGLIIHVFIAIFTFLGLAIVCEEYFVSSVDRICEELRLSPDVAGATLMAAGSSAPELSAVIIGVFFAKDDIGATGIIGSAVFNMMLVISVCALFSGTVCHLNWWPLVRDCFFYSLSIFGVLVIMLNDYISWYEALMMILFYVFYCMTLYFNTALEKWAYSLKLPIKLPTKREQSAWVTFKILPDPNHSQNPPADANGRAAVEQKQPAPSAEAQQPQTTHQLNYGTHNNQSWNHNAPWNQGQQNYGYSAAAGDQSDQVSPSAVSDATQNAQKKVGAMPALEFYKSIDPKASQIFDPMIRPTNSALGPIALLRWRVCYPIHFLCQITVPDCRTAKHRNLYGFTFVISMLWISFYSYLMVWMITIIGHTLGVPDTVMGLTFVAAGLSIPGAISSMAVIKEGYGDMAVSNAVGSNVFHILICLGLRWLIQTIIIDAGGHVDVMSKGLGYSMVSLLSTVVFLVMSVHLNGWKLDRRLGAILMVWYLLFIALASMYELDVFGYFIPPQCANPTASLLLTVT